MFRIVAVTAIGVALAGGAMKNFQDPSDPSLPQSSFAPVGAETSIPYGWVDFCHRHAEECSLGSLKPLNVRLTRSTWALINSVNKSVNESIEPMTNLAHWGTTLDHWDYPVDGRGDCKVYALYKRKLLIAAGMPRQALLMTIVKDITGAGHAVLTVKTDRGDFILDNLVEEIRPWNMTNYTFVKRQAQYDINLWLDMGNRGGSSVLAEPPSHKG